MPRDAVSRTANVERNGGHKWVKEILPATGRESGTSRHHGDPIKVILKHLKHHRNMILREFKGALNYAGREAQAY